MFEATDARPSARVAPDDSERDAPPAVVTAVAIGTAPLPIIGVYAVLFLVHGSIRPVQPPDVTNSKTGEFIVGWIAVAVFIALTVALLSFLNGRRRWPFAVMELGILALCIYFASDDTISGRFVSVLVAVLCVAALILAFTPQGWRHVGRPVPERVAGLFGWPPRAGALPGRRKPRLPLGAQSPPVEPYALPRDGSSASDLPTAD